MIANELINNFHTRIRQYFPSKDWEKKYRDSLKQIDHDEPWLTLIACYSIFGDQMDLNGPRLEALKTLLDSAGLNKKFRFSAITKVKVEEKLPEIETYREYLREKFKSEIFHFYPDRIKLIEGKLKKEKASFEGNTNLDLLIEGISYGKKTTLFIESKFLSDISYQITYNPIRDQIIRNIDCGIDYVLDRKYAVDFEDFYFLLLTPKVFKTKLFGAEVNNGLSMPGASSSRLYCYKMNDYKNPQILKNLLPHRHLKDSDWTHISSNIGWLAFEDFWINAKLFSTIQDKNEESLIEDFFRERNLV